jgi:hypothetical protein
MLNASPMEVPLTLPLCDYEDARGCHRLTAVLDAETLTYHVDVCYPDGLSRRLNRHLPSLEHARRWATAHRARQLDGTR